MQRKEWENSIQGAYYHDGEGLNKQIIDLQIERREYPFTTVFLLGQTV